MVNPDGLDVAAWACFATVAEGQMPRNWEEEQMSVLAGAEEWQMLEDYKEALAKRDQKVASPAEG